MSFSEYNPQTVTINTNSAPITLRGLNVDDFGYLIGRHGALMDTCLTGDPNLVQIVSKAPALVADVIACAADERDQTEKAASFPLGLQYRVLSEIFRLTFSEVDMGKAVGAFLSNATTGTTRNAPAI